MLIFCIAPDSLSIDVILDRTIRIIPDVFLAVHLYDMRIGMLAGLDFLDGDRTWYFFPGANLIGLIAPARSIVVPFYFRHSASFQELEKSALFVLSV